MKTLGDWVDAHTSWLCVGLTLAFVAGYITAWVRNSRRK